MPWDRYLNSYWNYIGVRVFVVWSESLLSAWIRIGSLATHVAYSEDWAWAERKPRLILVFAVCTGGFFLFRLSHDKLTIQLSNVVFYKIILITCFYAHQMGTTLDAVILGTKKDESRHDKTNKMRVRPEKIQISLGIRPVWSESSLSAWRKLGSLATHWVQSEDSNQTGRMPRLIWVFPGRTLILLVLSCHGSDVVRNLFMLYVYSVPNQNWWRFLSFCHQSIADFGYRSNLLDLTNREVEKSYLYGYVYL